MGFWNLFKTKDKINSHSEHINAVIENNFNIDFYENSTALEITSNNSNLPYYLTNEEISINDTIKELKEWTNTGILNKDKIYDSMIKELDTIKNNITWTKDIPNDNIEVCSKGLELSIKLCNYCIEHGYDKLKFVRFQTKSYFDDFKEKLEHWKIYNSYKEAEQLEKNGLFENAIKKYMDILTNHIPLGSIYYETPFYLSIKILNYEHSNKIYSILKDNFIKTQNKVLENTIENLTTVINSLGTSENMYIKIKAEIFSIIETNPGILQSTLYKQFDLKYKESLRFIIYYLEKSDSIIRLKEGRSYSLFLNNH